MRDAHHGKIPMEGEPTPYLRYYRRTQARSRGVRARPGFGLMVCSACSRSFRAISTGSASINTIFAASSQTSYCADRISASMISTARSFWLRLASPAVRYQTETARSCGSVGHQGCTNAGGASMSTKAGGGFSRIYWRTRSIPATSPANVSRPTSARSCSHAEKHLV